MGKSNLRFVHVEPHGTRIEQLRRFYAEQYSEHLYPRTHAELADIADEGAMFAVEHGDVIAAACYVKWHDPEAQIREFGGICVGPAYGGKKIASTLACIAIGQALTSAETASLKANVHIDNGAPNGLLSSLGFELTTQIERLPPEKVRPPMKPTGTDGSVTGRVWEFDFSACQHIAKRLRGFPVKIDDCTVTLDFGESVGPARPYLIDLAIELEKIAAERGTST
jgi:RimJ/RimL family protein N-acetyltransferase